jgi:Fic family protein
MFHHKLASVHPFWDSNGRVSRIMMNVGYPMAIILKNDRQKYYRVFSEADKGNYNNLFEFVAQSTVRSLNIYLNTLAPSRKKEDILITLAELSKQCDYTPDYLKN